MNGKKIVGWLLRISPEAIGRAARFACRVAIRLPDEQREELCAARSQEVERSLEGCGITSAEDDMRQTYTVKHIRKGLTLLNHWRGDWLWAGMNSANSFIGLSSWKAGFQQVT